MKIPPVVLMAFVLMCGTAVASIHGPYEGHPPAGLVAPDNVLQVPSHPQGYVMLVHGGGWLLVGKQYLETADARWFEAQGWATYDIDYRGGWNSMADVTAAYDHLRKMIGPSTTVCVQGESAGATMAMLLAAERPSVACVISEGGISDITTMPNPFRANVNTYVLPGHLWAFSPVREASLIKQPLLMAGSSWDKVVPESQQMAEMKTARPSTKTMLLAGAPILGSSNFVHANITVGALARFRAAEIGMLNRATRQDRAPAKGWQIDALDGGVG